MTETKSLIARVTRLEIKTTKNNQNIQKLKDNTNVVTELVKNILEKLMELVDVLNERKIIDSDGGMEETEEEITSTSQDGGEK